MKPGQARLRVGVGLCAMVLGAASAAATGDGKLLLTGGIVGVDGAAGGGLTPWALIGSHATERELGVAVHASRLRTSDYALTTAGLLLAWDDRFEISLAQQDFDAGDRLAALGLRGLHLRQTMIGAKLRVAGEAVLDADRWLPQLAVGVIHRRAQPQALGPVLTGAIGARLADVEPYVAATKLLLAPAALVNATLRATRANQNGLLGFGGGASGSRRVQAEVSLAWLLSPRFVLGGEYRMKPQGLRRSALGDGALAEDDWRDLFVAYAPDKRIVLTLAWVDLGRIAPAVQPRRQRGGLLSLQWTP
jgi:hypothetical protein